MIRRGRKTTRACAVPATATRANCASHTTISSAARTAACRSYGRKIGRATICTACIDCARGSSTRAYADSISSPERYNERGIDDCTGTATTTSRPAAVAKSAAAAAASD